MIRGPVEDPLLTLDNAEIALRHVIAYLLQRYHQAKLPDADPSMHSQLFAVLGSVADFKNSTAVLNRDDFARWLRTNEKALAEEVQSWLPPELSPAESRALLHGLTEKTLRPIDEAINYVETQVGTSEAPGLAKSGVAGSDDAADSTNIEVQDEEGVETPGRNPAVENLLDRLLYCGVLPRYAFPTDVATFYVFDQDKSTRYRPAFHYAPQQGLAIALTQYAPGKEVWIDGKLWVSGAIYSPMGHESQTAWTNRRLYYECSTCHYACTLPADEGVLSEQIDCDACGDSMTLGPASYWLRPPGFAHPVFWEEGTSPDDQPAKSYATRAKLSAPAPTEESKWASLNPRLRTHHMRQHLLVTNRGPRDEGYNYCRDCGLIEPTASPVGVVGTAHKKPFPDEKRPNCPASRTTSGLVLGTDFITDVLLISLCVDPPLNLKPGLRATDVALRTVSEALSKAGCDALELEAAELQAEYRPALTARGWLGMEAEIYIYDTLPGGAGFARRLGEIGLPIFEKALKILEECPEGCDRSCYRCLRSYKNKFEHDLLDRQLGAVLLRFLLKGEVADLPKRRLELSTDLLFEDLERQGLDTVKFERNQVIEIPGFPRIIAPILATRTIDSAQFVVGLHCPITPDHAMDTGLRELKEYGTAVRVQLEDELVVRRNLPSATRHLLSIVQ